MLLAVAPTVGTFRFFKYPQLLRKPMIVRFHAYRHEVGS